MAEAAFDTLSYANRLKKVGVPPTDIGKAFAKLNSKIDIAFSELKSALIRYIVVSAIAQTTIICLFVKFGL